MLDHRSARPTLGPHGLGGLPAAALLGLATGWRERFNKVETCARNPGGTSCVEVYTRPAPAVPYQPCTFCTAPERRSDRFCLSRE